MIIIIIPINIIVVLTIVILLLLFTYCPFLMSFCLLPYYFTIIHCEDSDWTVLLLFIMNVRFFFVIFG